MPKSLFAVLCAVLLCSHSTSAGLLHIPSNYASPLTYAAGFKSLPRCGYAAAYARRVVSVAPSLNHPHANAYAAPPHFKYVTALPSWSAYPASAYATRGSFPTAAAYGAPNAYTASYAALSALTRPVAFASAAPYASAPVITKYSANAPWASYVAPLGSW